MIESLIQDLSYQLEGKFFDLHDLHSFTKSIFAIDSVSEDTMKGLVSYFIDLGYDAEDLLQSLGLTKSVSFLHRLLFNHADKLEEHSPNFLVQLEDFIRGNLKQMNKL